MGTITTTLAGTILVAGLLSGATAYAQEPCARDAETFRLQIRVNNNNVPEGVELGGRDASTIHACPGDTVLWQFTGRPFEVLFNSGTPFDGPLSPSANGKISGVISAEGTRGNQYKYDVAIEGGGVLDPIIIVD